MKSKTIRGTSKRATKTEMARNKKILVRLRADIKNREVAIKALKRVKAKPAFPSYSSFGIEKVIHCCG